jgi:hypothetical protein
MLRVAAQFKFLYHHWKLLGAVVRILHLQDELHQLIRWAKRKDLFYPLHLYRQRIADNEVRLNQYMLRYPRLYDLARWLHGLHHLVTPKPRYYKRGSAAKFRRHC